MPKVGSFLITHIKLPSFLCDIGKQCRSISDATKHLFWSGLALHCLFYRISIQNEIKMKINIPSNPKIENMLFQLLSNKDRKFHSTYMEGSCINEEVWLSSKISRVFFKRYKINKKTNKNIFSICKIGNAHVSHS